MSLTSSLATAPCRGLTVCFRRAPVGQRRLLSAIGTSAIMDSDLLKLNQLKVREEWELGRAGALWEGGITETLGVVWAQVARTLLPQRSEVTRLG